jgi:putative NIF3 family GTP cyclohydrolase 1 type 2
MTARDLNEWLRSLHAVPEPSVDRIIAGDGAIVVRGIAVVWMPTWASLRDAHANGLNVVVAHEPTFYSHYDLDRWDDTFAKPPAAARAAIESTQDAKRRWIKENNMAVIRCHDVLDAMPGGVVDSFAAALGFSTADYLSAPPHYRVIRLAQPAPAAEVARRLADAFGPLGQPGVAFYGDPNRGVTTLGLGTGFGCDPWRFVELGAEMAVTIDDRIKTWIEGEWAEDSGYPIVVIHHGTSEEWGVRRLAQIIAGKFPELPVQLLPQGCTFRWIPARTFDASRPTHPQGM